MIRYELKDKERQAAFEKALPGFDEKLQTACKYQYGDGSCCVTMQLEAYKGILISNLIFIDKDAIAAKEVYDPKKWNSYPEVTPPEGVWMRVEGVRTSGFHVRDGAIFLRGDWYWRLPRASDPNAHCARLDNQDVERFRPWTEEDEE